MMMTRQGRQTARPPAEEDGKDLDRDEAQQEQKVI
jgi:hypothetical protein